MGSVYSGSYMGFPAPPRLKPWRVKGAQRKRASILRAAGRMAAWEFVGAEWQIVQGYLEPRFALVHSDGSMFLTARAYYESAYRRAGVIR